ncbi:MAG: alpha/beta hydrolase [Gemmatimonadaceae bacterium]
MTKADAAIIPGHTRTGDLRTHHAFHSKFLTTDHDVYVYLPPTYGSEDGRRYPVLYMHDGQNLFDRATAFRAEWQVDETAQRLILSGAIEPLIIVGISNAGIFRIEEYTPTRDRIRKIGGSAALYGRMLVEELKPFVDAEYRTLSDVANTGMGGSSLGGLVSLYFGLLYSDVFSRLAIISPSVWWDNRFIVRRVRNLGVKPPSRVWLSAGTLEGPGVIEGARRIRDIMIAKGWTLGEDLSHTEIEGGHHTEEAWVHVVEPMLKFLFPGVTANGGQPSHGRTEEDGVRKDGKEAAPQVPEVRITGETDNSSSADGLGPKVRRSP